MTATEAALAELVSDVLQQPRDPMSMPQTSCSWALDSIAALSVVQAARARGIALRARLILECANVRELAAAIDSEAADITPVRRRPCRRHRPDPAAAQRPLALRIRRAAPTRSNRSHPVARRRQARAPKRTALAGVIDGHDVLHSRLDQAPP